MFAKHFRKIPRFFPQFLGLVFKAIPKHYFSFCWKSAKKIRVYFADSGIHGGLNHIILKQTSLLVLC